LFSYFLSERSMDYGFLSSPAIYYMFRIFESEPALKYLAGAAELLGFSYFYL